MGRSSEALQDAVANAVDDVKLSDSFRIGVNAREFLLNVQKYNLDIYLAVLRAKQAPLERVYLRAKINQLADDASTDDDIIDSIREREALELEKNNGWRANDHEPKQSPMVDKSSSATTAGQRARSRPPPPSSPESSASRPDVPRVPRSPRR